MNPRIIAAIVGKDLRAFTRDRFFFFITVIGLIAYAVMYFVIPSDVDETVSLGVYQEDLDPILGAVEGARPEGLRLVDYPTAAALREAVEAGSDGVIAGISFPPGFRDAVEAGEFTSVELLVPADVSDDHRLLMEGLVREIAFTAAGSPPPVDPITSAVVLGTDRVGDQISLQDQMRPLLLFLVLMVETFALASLVAVEIQERTVTAVLATPARVGDVIAAKGAFGTGLAFFEVSLLAAVIGALATNLPVMVVALLLGSILVTGFGLIAGSAGRDFIEILFISFAFMIPLTIPAFSALFPGSAPTWVQVIPSYGLIDTITGITARGETLAEVGAALALLAAWAAAAFTAGTLVLRRRVVSI
jgi:ABC-2 type transport system permease protein